MKAWWALLPGVALTGLGAYEYLAPRGAPLLIVSHQQAVLSAICGALIAPFGAYWSMREEQRDCARKAAMVKPLGKTTITKTPRGKMTMEVEGELTETGATAALSLFANRSESIAYPSTTTSRTPPAPSYEETTPLHIAVGAAAPKTYTYRVGSIAQLPVASGDQKSATQAAQAEETPRSTFVRYSVNASDFTPLAPFNWMTTPTVSLVDPKGRPLRPEPQSVRWLSPREPSDPEESGSH